MSRAARAARRRLRGVLAAVLVALAALSGGCADSGAADPLVVLGPWSGAEAAAFQKVLHRLEKGTGRTYTYQGTASLRETLVAQLEADDPPDVAVLNSLAELTEYVHRGKLKPLGPGAAERAYAPWAPPLTVDGARRAYWVPLKVDLKSLVWSKEDAGDSSPSWCLGLAAAATSGWPGTDWVEDILLHQQGADFYADWATGHAPPGADGTDGASGDARLWDTDEVRKAWRTWGGLLTSLSGQTRKDSLTEPYTGAPDRSRAGASQGLLNTQECDHEHQSAFIRYVYAEDGDRIQEQPAAPFLRGEDVNDDLFEVSGDMAAVFSDDPDARRLVEQLSGAEGRAAWRAAARPELQPLFPSGGDPQPTETLGHRIAGTLSGTGSGERARLLCFDASDVMPPMLRDAFQRAVLQYVGDPRPARLDALLEQLDTVSAKAYQDAEAGGDVLSADDVCAAPSG